MAAPAAPDIAAAPETARRSAFTPRDAVLLVVLGLLWGHSFLLVKIAVVTVPPTWIVGGRMVVGALVLLMVCGVRRQRLPRSPRQLATLAAIGLVGTALGWVLHSWATQFLDSGLVAVLNATTPAATLGLAVAVGQERLSLTRVAGLAVALVGTLIVVGGEIGGGSSVPALLVAVLATFSYGLGSVWMRARISGRLSPLPAAAAQVGGAALVLVPLTALVVGPVPAPATVGLGPGLAILGLGVGGTALAFLIYNTLLARVGATNASMVTYLVPIVGLVSGAVFRGEQFGWNVLAGAAVLIGGVWLAQRRPASSLYPVISEGGS